uniref:Multidrug and toxic compound extrusion protein n=1 Tax=Minutocellus polymorphus TaxID=265543 RepID=A0A7S0ANF4_9STRA|mmetsp:Transcript_17655/g.29348  ORF Transcript_17655/g.29348 Transcript_17655/m.29348 type:complete len:505 (+) Transcript_17655:130-1644(+)
MAGARKDSDVEGGVVELPKGDGASASPSETTALLAQPADTTPSQVPRETFLHDIWDTIELAVPIFVAMVSWIGMKTTDTSLLGHVGAEALSASALSDLWTMCSGVLVNGRILRVLVGQSVGAGNPKLAGAYLQVSYFILSLLSVPVIACWLSTKFVWRAMGQGDEITADAGYYATVLALSIPGQIVYSQLSQFFSSQRIMHPEVIASSSALGLNLLFGLIFVLGVGIPNFSGFGFVSCPWVTTTVVYVQGFLLWYIACYRQRLHEKCWGGWNRSSITTERIKTFSSLYFPAALSAASDFWRMGVIGLIAANLGELEVGVFNTSYRIMWIVLIMVSAVANAGGIKMSLRLGSGDAAGAKQAGVVIFSLALSILVAIALLVVSNIRHLGMIFTQDKEFLDMFEASAVPFTCTLFFMNLSVAIEQIPMSMGRTSEVFWYGFVASWFGQVPGAYFLTKHWRDDLIGLYSGMAIGYVILSILYGILAYRSDWQKYADVALRRSETKSTS